MFSLILLAGLLVAPQQAFMTCTNMASTETQTVQGPARATAILKISTEDDHNRNTHLCQADYQLVITNGSGSDPLVQTVITSDGVWDRRMSVRLSGFSRDGKHIFGMLSEKSRNASLDIVFDYDTANKRCMWWNRQGLSQAACRQVALPERKWPEPHKMMT